MTTTFKVLGQLNPAATTASTLYTVPGATSAVVSTLTVCNLAAAAATYRIAVRPAGAGLANVHYVCYDNVVNLNDTVILNLGLTLAATDVLTVYASTSTISFHCYGSEIT